MKIVVIYDSKTGNTEKIAKAIAENVPDVVLKKIGEAFPLSLLVDADAVLFGSPVRYADITNEMKDFLDRVESYIKAGKMKTKNIVAGIFGSYGYDGAWIFEDRLKARVEKLGYKIYDKVLVVIDNDVKYNMEDVVKKAKEFTQEFTESI